MAKFQPGHPKLGGRKKGTKNKATVLRAEQVMAEMEFNPVREMIIQATDPHTPPEIKAKLNLELSRLLNPPAKASESSTEPPAIDADEHDDQPVDNLLSIAEAKE